MPGRSGRLFALQDRFRLSIQSSSKIFRIHRTIEPVPIFRAEQVNARRWDIKINPDATTFKMIVNIDIGRGKGPRASREGS